MSLGGTDGERTAWIDGGGTIAGPSWIIRPLLIRPASRTRALQVVESLLRSGGFSLVVLTGVELEGAENVRLSRAAHDEGGAVVALTTNVTIAGLKVSSAIHPRSYRWHRDPHGNPAVVESATLEVRATALGWHRRARIVVPVMRYDLPAALDPALPDRRGTVYGVRR